MDGATRLEHLRAGLSDTKQYSAQLFLTLAEAVEELAGKIREDNGGTTMVDDETGETYKMGVRSGGLYYEKIETEEE